MRYCFLMNTTRDSQETRSASSAAGQVVSPWSARVAAARKRAGLTQEALAEAAGVSVGTVKNIEHGATKPQKAKLDAVKMVLGLDRDLSQGWSDEQWQIAEVVATLFDRLPEGQKAAAAGRVTALFVDMLTEAATAPAVRAVPDWRDYDTAARKGKKDD